MSTSHDTTTPRRPAVWGWLATGLLLLALGASLWWARLQPPQTVPQLLDAAMGQHWGMSPQEALTRLQTQRRNAHELVPALLDRLTTSKPQQRPWLLFVLSSLTHNDFLKVTIAQASAGPTPQRRAAIEVMAHTLQRHGVGWLVHKDPRLVHLVAHLANIQQGTSPSLKALAQRHINALRRSLETTYIQQIQKKVSLWSNTHPRKWRTFHGVMHETLRRMALGSSPGAARALTTLGQADAHALPAFKAFLTEALPLRFKRASLTSLTKMGPDAAPLLPQLLQLLKHPSLWLQALKVIGAIGPKAAKAIPQLVAQLRKPAKRCHPALLETIGAFGPKAHQAIPTIMGCIPRTITSDKQRRAAALAWRILGQLKARPKQLISRLHQLLLSEAQMLRARPLSGSWELACAYIQALGHYGPLAAPALRTMLLFLKIPAKPKPTGLLRIPYASPKRRTAQAQVLDALARMGVAAQPALPMLLALSHKADSWNIRQRTQQTISQLGDHVYSSYISCVSFPDDNFVAISQRGQRWLKQQELRWKLTYNRDQKKWAKPLLAWARQTTPTLQPHAILTGDQTARDKALWLHHALKRRCSPYGIPPALFHQHGSAMLLKMLTAHRTKTPYVWSFRRRIFKALRDGWRGKPYEPLIANAALPFLTTASPPRVYADALRTFMRLTPHKKPHDKELTRRWQQAVVHRSPLIYRTAGELLKRSDLLAQMILPQLTTALTQPAPEMQRKTLHVIKRANIRHSRLFAPLHKLYQAATDPQLKQLTEQLLMQVELPSSARPHQHKAMLDLLLKQLSPTAPQARGRKLIIALRRRYESWSAALQKPTPQAERQRIYRRLKPYLKDKDPQLVKEAFTTTRSLGLSRDKDIQLLRETIDNDAATVKLRLKAAGQLFAHGKVAVMALPLLFDVLKQSDKRRRRQALALLGRLYRYQKDSRPFFQAIVRAYQAQDLSLQQQAFRLLCKYEARDPRPLPWLLRGLNSMHRQKRRQSLQALQRRSSYSADAPRVVKALFDQLKSTIPPRQRRRTWSTGSLRQDSANSRRLDQILQRSGLLGLGLTSDAALHRKTIEVLIAYGRAGTLVIKKAHRLLQTTPNNHIKRACIRILAVQGARARAAIPALVQLLPTRDDELRKQTLAALQALKAPPSQLMMPLLALLSPTYKATHAQVLQRLGTMTPRRKAAHTKLVRLLRSRRDRFRALAITLLSRVPGVDIKSQLTRMARLDPSPKIRHLASRALQGQLAARSPRQRKTP